jgi:TetR/AcrR family transcriptional regulator, cholesterol catabolism regulator
MNKITSINSKGNDNKSKRRKEIFDEAIRLFNKKGLANTSVREIAEASGLTIGGLYYYIKSKDEIFYTVTENSVHFHESIKNFRKTLGDVSPTEAFRKCLKYWLTISPYAMEQTIFVEREKIRMSPKMQEKQSNTTRHFIHFFEDMLKDGIAAGQFEVENITLIAFLAYMLRGLFAVKQWFLADLITPEEYATQMTNVILKLILVDKTKIYQEGKKPIN